MRFAFFIIFSIIAHISSYGQHLYKFGTDTVTSDSIQVRLEVKKHFENDIPELVLRYIVKNLGVGDKIIANPLYNIKSSIVFNESNFNGREATLDPRDNALINIKGPFPQYYPFRIDSIDLNDRIQLDKTYFDILASTNNIIISSNESLIMNMTLPIESKDPFTFQIILRLSSKLDNIIHSILTERKTL
ncbi:hypothetical protein [Fulvivirga lutea]|uniref:Uncharacterized protein n=1 Tax=Fulvivirga lutea TaxID=2810512 RepID=A0A975A2M8_9BACT|nr:hypothetical protein [Fulvivirga lutea]QSE99011.1 hypothetical protein JR347_07975 [Fulvivirga lutea]